MQSNRRQVERRTSANQKSNGGVWTEEVKMQLSGSNTDASNNDISHGQQTRSITLLPQKSKLMIYKIY